VTKEDTMKRLIGGEKAAPGFYWDSKAWELVTVSPEAPRLPGDAERSFRRVPALGVLALAPLMGAMFVVFLPFVGFAMVIDQGGRRVMRLLRGAPAAGEAPVKRGSRRA
jgi:hypothetical protein